MKRSGLKIFRFVFFRWHPVVKQHDQLDCGPAALVSILRYYGGDASLAFIRELCHTTVNGTTMFDLIAAARVLGFSASGVYGEYSDLLREKMPCIAYVIRDKRYAHYVVVYAIYKNKVLLGDPARGLYKLSRSEFLKIWQQKAVVLLDPGNKIYKQITVNWFEWLYPHLRTYKSWILQSLFLGIVYSLLSMIMALFVQKIIDLFIPSGDINTLMISGFILFILITLKSMLGYARQYFLIHLNTRVGKQLNSEFLIHVLRLPKKFLDIYRSGDIISRINDVIRIQQGIMQIIGVTLIDLMLILSSVLLIFAFSAKIAYITLLIIPFYTLFLALNIRSLDTRQHAVLQSYAEVQSTFINTIQGYDEILNYNAASFFSEKNCLVFNDYQQQIKMLGLIKSKFISGMEQLGNMIMLALLVIGAIWVIREELLLGQMMASYSLVAGILPALNRLVEGTTSWQISAIAVRRLLDLLQMRKEKESGCPLEETVELIQIKNAGFRWTDYKRLFDNVSITLHKGQLTALWGPIGSGKSTLMHILQRKYPLATGEIIFGGKNSQEYDLHTYRGKIGIVPQQVKIFNGTLAENMLLGRRVATLKGFDELISRYHFDTYIRRFERGLLTLLGENGQQLSGGELQILGLARSLLLEPDILMIDEGLSALDSVMEKMVFQMIKEYAQTHIVLICTHNYAMITRMDYVYILNQGRIIQAGRPVDLLTDEGYFKGVWRMWKSDITAGK